TEKRKARRAASIPASFQPRPWNPKKCPAFFSSERWSTSPANSAASISSGPGRRDSAPDRRCEFTWETVQALEAAVANLRLNLRAFLHERHAREDFRGLLQMLQVFAGEVCARERSIQPFARNLHHSHHAAPGGRHGNGHDFLNRHLLLASIFFCGSQFDRFKQADMFYAHETI